MSFLGDDGVFGKLSKRFTKRSDMVSEDSDKTLAVQPTEEPGSADQPDSSLSGADEWPEQGFGESEPDVQSDVPVIDGEWGTGQESFGQSATVEQVSGYAPFDKPGVGYTVPSSRDRAKDADTGFDVTDSFGQSETSEKDTSDEADVSSAEDPATSDKDSDKDAKSVARKAKAEEKKQKAAEKKEAQKQKKTDKKGGKGTKGKKGKDSEADKADKAGKGGDADKDDKADKAGKSDDADKAGKGGDAGKDDKADKVGKGGKDDKAGKDDKGNKDETQGKGKKKKDAKAKKAAAKHKKEKKAKKEKKVKPTKEEKLTAKLEKEAARHEKKIEAFEKRALAQEKKMEKKAEKKAHIREVKAEGKAVIRDRVNVRKQRKKELKQQRKYWLKKGVGKTAHKIKITACAVLMIGLFTSGAAFVYQSDQIHVPFVNTAVDAVLDSPLKVVPAVLEKPVKAILAAAQKPVALLVKTVKGKPKFEDFYYYEAANAERYTNYQKDHPNFTSDEVVWRVNAGCDLMLYESSVVIADFSVVPLVVNKFNSLPPQFVPSNMTEIPGTYMRADQKTFEAFQRLQQAAAEEGLDIAIASAYRSYEYQDILYNPDVPDKREDLEAHMPKPGFSENQTGQALDLCVGGGKMQDFPGTPEAAWVSANAERFGFLLRYTEELEDVTGFRSEPWHIRYVGDDVIKVMQDKEIKTLEEYKVKYMDHKEGDKPETPKKNEVGNEDAHGPI